jgi:hypothetical protein
MALKRTKMAGAPRLWVPRPFHILALDPGGTTGWATATYNGNDELHFVWDSGHLTDDHFQELLELLYYHLTQANKEEVGLELVCESFQFRQHINSDKAKTKVELFSCEYIGVVKLFEQMNDVPVYFQTASAAKTLCPDKGPQSNVKLKQVGVYKPVTDWVHAMDAMRHLLRYMVTDKRIRNPITNKWLED